MDEEVKRGREKGTEGRLEEWKGNRRINHPIDVTREAKVT